MAKKKIIIGCFPDGTSVLEGEGFAGTECNEAMRSFEKLMGKRIDRGNKCDTQSQSRVNCQNT